jgi:opacity protein-like surface antigen
MKSFFAFVLVLAVSAPALAQTLAVDVSPPQPIPSAGPIEIVSQPPPAPPVARPQPYSAPIVAAPQPEEEDEPAAYVGLTLWGEQMNLSGSELTFRAPEVQAVTGLVLGTDWAGQEALREQSLGGLSLAIGMRGFEFLRGPELRLMFGGGEMDGDYLPTTQEGIDVALQGALTFRLEAAIGLQVPLGPVVPYVLARAAVGAVWLDVGVRDARLGELGTETLDMTTLELGMEAGLGFRVCEGVELGLAFRGTFLGNESLGGMVSLGFDGSTVD